MLCSDLIVNQVVMSEEERDKIIQEHEKNLAELESSLTLNKLRQRQMLEEKLSQRRKRRMEQLEQRQMEETKVLSGSIYARDGSSASTFLLDASCSPAEGDKLVQQIT